MNEVLDVEVLSCAVPELSKQLILGSCTEVLELLFEYLKEEKVAMFILPVQLCAPYELLGHLFPSSLRGKSYSQKRRKIAIECLEL